LEFGGVMIELFSGFFIGVVLTLEAATKNGTQSNE
jgi:hypothetical protein